jgi:Fe-S-cluster containining protein
MHLIRQPECIGGLAKLMIKGHCIGCGMCCRAITLAYTKKDIRKVWPEDKGTSKWFVLKNWHRISRDQALKENPNVVNMEKQIGWYWYTCSMFDRETNKCKVHDSKPRICKGYPWYGNEPNDTALYGANCGYRVDQRSVIANAEKA